MHDQQEQSEEQRLFGDALGDRDRRSAGLRRQRHHISRGEQALKLSPAGGLCPRAIDHEDGGWISRHFSLKASALPGTGNCSLGAISDHRHKQGKCLL